MTTFKRGVLGWRGLITLFLILTTLLAAAPGAVAQSPRGTGPDDALQIPADWTSANPGERLWYSFEYAGDGSTIEVRLQLVPSGSADLEIWTPNKARRWRLGLEANPIGRGTEDPNAEDTLFWSGEFNEKGTYYAIVEHNKSQPGQSYYLLSVSGPGVSLAKATPAPAPKTKPTQAVSLTKPQGAPEGRLVFHTDFDGPIYTINVNGSNMQRVGKGAEPTWSPDGTQIAYVTWLEPRGVWVMDADGSGARRVFAWTETRSPSWSPDGTEVVFSRQNGGRMEDKVRCFFGFCFTLPAEPHWTLGIARPSDNSFREPSTSKFSRTPSWSPSGDRFVHSDELGLRVRSQDDSVSYLITDEGLDTSPVWSPDGQWVSFVRRQHDHWEIYMVDANGGKLRRITTTPDRPNGQPANSVSPAWSPDGAYLAFLTDRTGKWEIWVMAANGSNPRPLFDDELSGIPLTYRYIGERALSWTE